MNEKIIMELREFENIKTINIPDGYELSTISNIEDEKQWERLISEAFDFKCDINLNLKNESIYSGDRVFILKKNKKIVATAAAWYRKEFGENSGYLHMVAVDENERGLGISKYVIIPAIEYMINEGREKVVLKTDTFREAAINAYTKLGFKILNC